jgi:hypothetical protein
MRWAGHMARIEGEECSMFWWGNLRERDHLQDLGIDEKTTSKCIFKK